MPSPLATRIGLYLTAPLVGAVVALGLRGGWNGLLLVAFAGALAIVSYNTIVLACDPLLHFLLALGFYAVAFQGLLGPLGGAFGGVWFILVIAFALFQIGCVFICSQLVRSLTFRAVLLPFAVVSFEFLRHHAIKLYDGAGLTFCLVGQASASDLYLLQSADFGGVWLLSFYCAALGTAIAVWFVPVLSLRFRFICLVLGVWILGAAYIYGWCQILGTGGFDSASTADVYICPTQPNLVQVSKVADLISARSERYHPQESIVVFPETCTSWQSNDAVEGEQSAVLQLSRKSNVTVVLGAWYPAASHSNRNVSIILQNGKVAAVVDKLHLAPFVESKPLGTTQLVSAGLIPPAAVRDIGVAEPLDLSAWNSRTLKVAPSVCYDLFFSESFQRFPSDSVGANVCCLDETFDGNGVFQKLSKLHSRLRAVEMRQPVVRSSLGGLSGAFDRQGVELLPLESNADYSVYQIQPEYRVTICERWGDWFPVFCCAFCFAGVLVHRFRTPLAEVERK